MQQIIVIQGGTTFLEYNNYLGYLGNKSLNVDRLTYSPMWKELLQSQLGADYQVLLPTMPNKTNARYNEWEIWFTHLASIMTDGCILIGHSLGAIFLAQYLSENIFPKSITATILVAAPYDNESSEDLGDFKIKTLSDRLTEQAGRLVFFNGTDDPVVATSDSDKYKTRLPTAEFHTLPAPDHFMRPDFPELTALIKEL